MHIQWGEYLQKLAEDGVQVGETEDEAVIEQTGERVVSLFLSRVVNGQWRSVPIAYESLTDPVPRRKQRRIANQLALPPKKYVF